MNTHAINTCDVADLLRWQRESRVTGTSAGTVARLEAELAAFRAQAEEHFRQLNETNMRLLGQIDRLRSANEAITLSLRLANREVERLKEDRDAEHDRAEMWKAAKFNEENERSRNAKLREGLNKLDDMITQWAKDQGFPVEDSACWRLVRALLTEEAQGL